MEPDVGNLIDVLPGLAWIALPDGHAERVGKGWLDFTGLRHDQAIGDGWLGAVHPEDASRLLTSWASIIASGRMGEVEARLRRYDGLYQWFLFRLRPLPDRSGEASRWCGMNFDIDDWFRAEAPREHQRRFESMVDALPGLVWTTTPDGASDFINLRWREYAGLTLDEVRGRQGWKSTIHPDDLQRAQDSWDTFIAAGVPGGVEVRLRRFDGEYRRFEIKTAPISDDAGRIIGWCGINTDVEDRRRAEEALLAHQLAAERAQADSALRAGEEELRRAHVHLTEAQRLSQTGSFTWDFDKNELLWSEELCRIFELDPAKPVSIDLVREFVHPDDRPIWSRTVEGASVGVEIDLAYRILTASGAVKHLHAVGHRIDYDADRPVLIGAVQDVTERKAAEEAVNKARAELAHVARAATLSALTASIAHEVNQPLTSLVTNASTCLRMLAADPPNLAVAQTTAQRTIRDANRAADVIQRLRAMFARKEPATEAVDLNDAAREVLALSAGELQNARIVLETDFCDALPSLRGDRIQLQQVILNLVLNARDALRAVEGRPRKLWIATACDGAGQVCLTVRDEGTGIEPQNLDRLFDAFYSTKGEGMGIGLSISRSIIQAHDGRLWATSNERGPGATFSFLIPCDAVGSTEPVLKDA